MEDNNQARTASESADLGGRLPLLGVAELDDAQRELYQYLVETKITRLTEAGVEGQLPDGRLIGPFNFFLYSPQAGKALNEWMDAQDRWASIAPDVNQVVILTVGAAYGADYEVYAHTAGARRAGLSDESIRMILGRTEPDEVSDDSRAAYRLAYELVTEKSVSDETYQRAIKTFGLTGVVNLVHLIGYYVVTSLLLNAFDVPAPTSRPRRR